MNGLCRYVRPCFLRSVCFLCVCIRDFWSGQTTFKQCWGYRDRKRQAPHCESNQSLKTSLTRCLTCEDGWLGINRNHLPPFEISKKKIYPIYSTLYFWSRRLNFTAGHRFVCGNPTTLHPVLGWVQVEDAIRIRSPIHDGTLFCTPWLIMKARTPLNLSFWMVTHKQKNWLHFEKNIAHASSRWNNADTVRKHTAKWLPIRHTESMPG